MKTEYEEWCYRQIQLIRDEYEKAVKPYIDILTRIESVRAPPTRWFIAGTLSEAPQSTISPPGDSPTSTDP